MPDRKVEKLPRLLIPDGCSVNFLSSASLNARPASPLKDLSKRIPRWPAIARLALNLLILLSSITVLGLIGNSAYQHARTKDINFSGTDRAWPPDLNLLPIKYLLAVAVVTLLSSLMASVHCYRRLPAKMLSAIDMTFAGLAMSLFGAWIGGDVILYQSLQAPERNLMIWACHRRSSPTNVIVKYNAVCQEQVSKHRSYCPYHR